jgi:hypothetical protein
VNKIFSVREIVPELAMPDLPMLASLRKM